MWHEVSGEDSGVSGSGVKGSRTDNATYIYRTGGGGGGYRWLKGRFEFGWSGEKGTSGCSSPLPNLTQAGWF